MNCESKSVLIAEYITAMGTVLRTGWIMTLHPSEGTAGKPRGALEQPSWHLRDRQLRGVRGETRVSIRKRGLRGGLD